MIEAERWASELARVEKEAFEKTISRFKEEKTMNVNGKWLTETEAEAYIVTLEHKVATLEEKHLNECRQISEYQAENKRMKELLAEALEDIGNSEDCHSCAYRDGNCPAATDVCCYHWDHESEVMELTGGNV